MRNPTILKSWLFVFPLAAALTGCTSLDAKTGAGRAAPGSLELKVGYGSEQPVELQVPVPDVNADVTQAIKGLPTSITTSLRASSHLEWTRPSVAEPSAGEARGG